MKNIFLFLLPLCLIAHSGMAQEHIAVGGAGAWNIQTEGVGLDLRVQFKVVRNLFIAPQVYYFPSFNKIHELYLGANFHYEMYFWKRITPYLIAGGAYNNWFNAADWNFAGAKRSNISPEGGAGILFGKGCIRPFIEQRYNPLWQEGTFRLGVLWYPLCKGERIGINKRTYSCPTYK